MPHLNSNHPPLVLDGSNLTLAGVESVARNGQHVVLGETARAAVEHAHEFMAAAANAPEPTYGINTGFGSLSRHRIERDDIATVQHNLLRSHAAGVGEPLEKSTVRAMMLVQAASLSRGHSGVRIAVIEQIIALLNANVTPVVPSRGSVGASGDLAPLSHASLVLTGEGEAYVDDCIRTGADALAKAGIKPLKLEAKEGLALINGTHMMAAIGALNISSLNRIIEAALVAAAMAVDACRGSDAPFDDRLHQARRQSGQLAVAKQLRTLLDGSQILPSHKDEDPRVQDPYCLRAMPQVIGAALDSINNATGVLYDELGAVTDNPLVFPDGAAPAIISGGNFHGMPLAIAYDTIAIAICHLAGIAERRIFWLLKASDSENPVNVYLSPEPGLHSGMMIVQYTAAACCNEMQTLATPASVANISTSAGIEDYNSMGATAAHQLAASIQLLRSVIAMELLVMSEAMEYQRPLRSGAGVEYAWNVIRDTVPRLTADRSPTPDIAAIEQLIEGGCLIQNGSST